MSGDTDVLLPLLATNGTYEIVNVGFEKTTFTDHSQSLGFGKLDGLVQSKHSLTGSARDRLGVHFWTFACLLSPGM